jgi:predicted CoA-binding protein
MDQHRRDGRAMPVKEAASAFLGHSRIAVTGVSRSPKSHGANVVYVRLRERGYDVVAVNPNADTVEGDRCYSDLASIPGGVDGVVIGTAPSHALATVRECIELGIPQVWFHRGPGGGSVDREAAEVARGAGLTVIGGGCPCMFGPTADVAHRCMRPLLTLTGNVPRRV